MSIFNEKQIKAMTSGRYICSECGHSIDLDEYGCEGDEKYENVYPTREDVLGVADEDE